MSPNVGNFVHDLVEMAKAMETLPQVEAALRTSEQSNRQLSETVASREEAILRYKAEIETLNAKVRATEAERDDAELRFLELDEKTHQVMGMLIDFEGKAKGARLILDPSKPVPMPEPEAKPEPVYTASGFKAQGQSVDDPIAMLPVSNSTESVAASDTGAEKEVSVSSPTSEPTGPYSGKRYYDHPTYVPLHDWIAGGGTEADYDWRPAPPTPRPIW